MMPRVAHQAKARPAKTRFLRKTASDRFDRRGVERYDTWLSSESPRPQAAFKAKFFFSRQSMAEFQRPRTAAKKRAKLASRTKKKDPIFVDGVRPRPMYIDYKDLELLGKLTSRQGKIIGRRKSGCTAASQHAVTKAVKRARFMALLPYVAD